MKEAIKKTVKDRYGKIAESNLPCCGTVSSCCGGSEVNQIGKGIGYSDREMASVPVEGPISALAAATRPLWPLWRPVRPSWTWDPGPVSTVFWQLGRCNPAARCSGSI